MSSDDPYAVLKLVFAMRFGAEALQALGIEGPSAQQPQQPPQDAALDPSQGMNAADLMNVFAQSEAARRAALTEELTQAASAPPVTENEVATLLNAALARGGNQGALALG